MSDDAELLSVAQLAHLLELDAEQILQWRLRGYGPPPVDDDPIPRWTPEAVEEWVSARIADEVHDAEERFG